MKRLLYLLCVLGVCLANGDHLISEASAKAKPHPQQAAKKQVSQAKKNKTGRPAASKGAAYAEGGAKKCIARRGKRVRCKPADVVLKSPIKEVDLDRQLAETSGSDVKARTAPERAYAVDGDSFFYQGRKFRISGMHGDDGSEMAKQRLQRTLDIGAIELDPQGIDESGVTTVVVRVNGKSIAELLPSP
ncbi:MAG: hypothetical protein RJA63_3525 [Pseudomonadota bacterium]|jgi:hypothetical protein